MTKNIVFDLDETIGHFHQIIYIMNLTGKNTENEVFELFDLFPECFRPNIFEIFNYLIYLRKQSKIKSILLYTNNRNDLFIKYIISYIHKKINYTLFDLIISFTTTQNKNKNITDLITHSNSHLLDNSSICYIDDKEYEYMKNKRLYYVKCESYKYKLPYSVIHSRLNINTSIQINEHIKSNAQSISYSFHSIISKEILKHIRLYIIINL